MRSIRNKMAAAFSILSIIGVPVLSAQDNDFSRYFDRSWQYIVVGPEQETLASNEQYPCAVKGYGWQLLGTERRRNVDTPWYSLGDTWQKWGWRVIVTSNRDGPVRFSFTPRLISETGYELDSDYLASKVLRPDRHDAFQGVGEYNASQRSDEGSPGVLTWNISCSEYP